MKEKKIIKFIKDEKNIEKLAKEIISIFEKEANTENIEYSFDISNGKMKSSIANTYFVFDTSKNTKIDKFKKYLFNEDLKDIKENSDEEKKILNDVREFLFKVCKNITDNYYDILEKIIRKNVLGNKVDKSVVPLDTIELIMMDVSDYSDFPEETKYLLKIFRDKNFSVDTDSIVSFVQNKKEETGMDYNEILRLEKEIGNPLFENVIEIQKGKKFLNDVTLYIYADYSSKLNS